MRRVIRAGFVSMLLAMVGMLSSAAHAADAAALAVEGTDYTLLSPAQPTSNPKKIVVSEFFSYHCSHCYAFHPYVTSWARKLPGDVVFERVPVSLGRAAWQPVSQAFYALQAMGKLEQLDTLIFSAIHTQKTTLYDEAAMTRFVAKQGVNAAEFTAAYNSFGVKSSLASAELKMKSHKVSGTPALVINGKYIIIAEGTRGYADLLARADRVIAKVRAEQVRK